MTCPTHSDERPVLTLLRQIDTLVGVAIGLAAAGRAVDLEGLDTSTGLLCAQVLDLAPSAGSSLRPALCKLQVRLDELSARLASAPA